MVCGFCKNNFDYGSLPEIAMGAAKCPHCGTVIDQTGKVCEQPEFPEARIKQVIADAKARNIFAREETESDMRRMAIQFLRDIDVKEKAVLPKDIN